MDKKWVDYSPELYQQVYNKDAKFRGYYDENTKLKLSLGFHPGRSSYVINPAGSVVVDAATAKMENDTAAEELVKAGTRMAGAPGPITPIDFVDLRRQMAVPTWTLPEKVGDVYTPNALRKTKYTSERIAKDNFDALLELVEKGFTGIQETQVEAAKAQVAATQGTTEAVVATAPKPSPQQPVVETPSTPNNGTATQ